MKFFVLVLVLGSASAFAQDPGAFAAEQAAQQAQQANQQAIEAAQQANQQATQNAQLNSVQAVAVTRQPTFSVKTGTVTLGTTVRMKCPTHYAVIYYTTNGWTPTTASRRYTGPITIRTTTQLQAIAIAPNYARSLIARVNYTVPGSADLSHPVALSADGVLHAATRLHLVTNSTVNSKTAQVGDSLSLLLDQDVKVGDTVVVPRGTPVDATITQADPSGHAGSPGDIAFEVHSLTVHGTEIPLHGGETLEGASRYNARAFAIIPVVGLIPAIATRGDDAEIKPGMFLTASVDTDTDLKP